MIVRETHGVDLIETFSKGSLSTFIHKNQALSERAKGSLRILGNRGLPGLKDEEYKYFPAFRKITSSLALYQRKPDKSSHDFIERNLIDDATGTHLVFVNGIFSDQFSKIQSNKDVNISILNNFKDDSLNNINFNGLNYESKDPYILLNNSFLHNYTQVDIVGRDSQAHVYFYYFLSEDIDNELINSQIVVNIADNSKAAVTEVGLSANTNFYFDNSYMEIHVGKNSVLDLNKIQEYGNESLHIHNTHIHQDGNSKVNTSTISLRGGMIRNNLVFHLNEENCESHLNGLYYLTHKNLIDNHTTVDHQSPNTFSNELYKGIIDEQGKGIFNGKIFVRPDAQKTNAFQSNKNIVLTDTATINTKPQLEIWADDVKCSHGATTGQIDEEQLFYLRSRGLSLPKAKALLLHAFAYEIIEKIENPSLRNKMEEKVNNRLGFNY